MSLAVERAISGHMAGKRISMPEENMYLKGQPDVLFEHLICPKTMIRFTTAEGAGAHCQCGADRLANARMFDWLDDTFGLTVKP